MTTKAKLKLKFTKCNQITAFTFLTLQTSNTTVVSSTSTEEINITTRVNHFMKCKNIIPFNTNINTDLCWRGEVAGGCWAGRGPLTTLAFSSSTHRALTPRLRLRWSWQEVSLRPQLVTRVRPAYTPHHQPFIQSLIMCNHKKIILLFWPFLV